MTDLTVLVSQCSDHQFPTHLPSAEPFNLVPSKDNGATVPKNLTRSHHFIQDPETGLMAGSHPEGGSDSGGGGGGGGGKEPDPEVAEVGGGDQWNKDTAARLENEYASVAPSIDQIASAAVGKETEAPESDEETQQEIDDNAPYVPDSWDSMSGDQQSDAEQAYKKNTYDDYYQSEVDNWYSEYAEDEARGKVAQEFTDGDETDWADDVIQGYLENAEEAGTKIPYTMEQIRDALTVEYETGNGSYNIDKYTNIDLDDSKLLKLREDEPQLPGVEPPDTAFLPKVRENLLHDIEKAFNRQAEKVKDKMEAPDYLSDSISEFQEENWSSMDDKDKFKYAESHTGIISDAQQEYDDYYEEHTGNKPDPEKLDALPTKFDPLQENNDTNYQRTQLLAKHASIERAAQLLVKRGLIDDVDEARTQVRSIDHELWDGWKGSSTSHMGWLLQVAAAEELGGRLNEFKIPKSLYGVNTNEVFDRNRAVTWADNHFSKIGFEGVKAVVRAKWETTQYLLDKAGIKTLTLYRGLDFERTSEHREKLGQAQLGAKDVKGYTALPTLHLHRNGAASTSLNPDVANRWDGENRVVVRFNVPRTAIISLPAYGINVHSEREVVVGGLAWRDWDAWYKKAPTADIVPMKKAA